MLVYCSFCNYQFSENVLKLLMVSVHCCKIWRLGVTFYHYWLCFYVISCPSDFDVMMSFHLIQHQYMTAPSNELKPVFSILTELLVGNRNWSSQGFTLNKVAIGIIITCIHGTSCNLWIKLSNGHSCCSVGSFKSFAKGSVSFVSKKKGKFGYLF